jgi:nicotinate-nucleotide pyrophosphorylase (carboxylating)
MACMTEKPTMPRELLPLYPLQYEPLVRHALEEDLGRAGDITTHAIIPPEVHATGRLVARRTGCIAGLDVAACAFRLLSPEVEITFHGHDGEIVQAGQTLAEVQGPARAILTAERVALNFLGRLSGVATASFGLDDAVLIKDNHIVVAGSIAEAVRRVRCVIGHLVKIEVEVDTLIQLEEALTCEIDAVLLDNMTPAQLTEAVRMVNKRIITEASGGITLETAHDIAAAGVDLLSAGWLTHSAPALDVALDVDGLQGVTE